MQLRPEYFRPFDDVYEAVTAQMKGRADRFPTEEERKWLKQIITDFKIERDLWPHSAPLNPYRRQWARLRLRVVRLVASIFLHVSYDLPRVLAKNWPGTGEWLQGPSEPRGEWLYFELRSIFSEILSASARRRRVTGIFAPMLCLVPLKLLDNLVVWVSLLREGAWRHGRTLAKLTPDKRAVVEQRMIEAMSFALRDVSNLPWAFTLPEPPNIRTNFAAGVPLLLMPPETFQATVFASMLILLGVVAYASWTSLRAEKISRFVDEFGSRVEKYVELAINDPEKFAEMKERSRDLE